jgi:hypothetical protein
VRRRAASGRATLALALGLILRSARSEAQTAPPSADQAFASYAFASELGSGVYEINGRALQIYRLPFAFEREGWRLTLPVTVGLLDFRSSDVIALNLPQGIGSVSLVPGLEQDHLLTPDWWLTHFAKAGYTKASGNAADSVQFGLGLRSTWRRPGTRTDSQGSVLPRAVEYVLLNELNLAVADLRGPLPGDSFLRLRNAAQWDFGTAAHLGERHLRIAPYLLLDVYLEAPTSPITHRDADRYQKEVGFSMSLEPRPTALGIPLPALGVSYRIAGDLSGWRLAIGAPF